MSEAAKKWGVNVTRVELQDVDPPKYILSAMEREMTAERNRRAIILDAEGTKSAAVLKAEGLKESEILQAEGQKVSEILQAEGKAVALLKVAEAEAGGIKLIQDAMGSRNDASTYRLAQGYLATLPELTKGGKGKTVVVPYDSSTLASMTSMIKNFWDNDADSNKKES